MTPKPPRIEFSNRFNKERRACSLEIRVAFREALELFLDHPYHPQLRNHQLQRDLSTYRSIDVTGDVRAIFKERRIGDQVIIIFHRIGTHEELYE